MKRSQTLKELREKDIKALSKELVSTTEKMAKLRRDMAFRKLKNVKQIMQTRQYIARLWTVMNEKAIQAAAKEVTK